MVNAGGTGNPDTQPLFASLSLNNNEESTKHERTDSAVEFGFTTPARYLSPTGFPGSLHAPDTMFAPLSRRLTDTDVKATEILRELCPDAVSGNQILRVGWHHLATSSVVHSPAVADELGPEQMEMIFISIKSPAISRFLESQTGFKFDTDGLLHVTRPFKVLIQNAAVIGDQLQKLESKYGSWDVLSPVDPVTPATSLLASLDSGTPAQQDDPDVQAGPFTVQPQELRGAIKHFRTLVKFMNKYMSPSIRTYNDLRAGRSPQVSFENLWMLFGTNETIYSTKQRGNQTWVWSNQHQSYMSNKPSDLPHAYKVAATFGGAPLMKKSDSDMWDTVFAQTSPFVDGHEGDADLRVELAKSTSVDLGVKESYSNLNILCYRLDFDGHEFGTIPGTFIIKPFEGLVDIVSLEVYPLSLRKTAPGPPDQDLRERGVAFVNLLHYAHRHYEGLTLGHKRDEINSQVCIDLKLAYQQQPDMTPEFMSLSDCKFVTHPRQIMELPSRQQNCEGSTPSWQWFSDLFIAYQQKMRSGVKQGVKAVLEDMDLDNLRSQKSRDLLIQTMEEHDLMCLLPCVVPGYALLLRKWVKLDIRLLKKIKPGRSWDELVLPSGHRDVVQAMVQHHAVSPKDTTDNPKFRFQSDLVEGKGRGCIILLHGAPGVGKTSTAECVAAYTNRPLFPITCGDIGYQPEQVERKLEDLFFLANRWGCVLLLDEADVFLAKRKTDDLKRNALVSVFLRILEYYAGILFLTTNRIGVFDDAFRSRLHLALFYPQLDLDQSKKVWKMNLDRVTRHSEERVKNGLPPIEVDRKGIKAFAKKTFESQALAWNGRQIKNAFQSALALAEMEAQKTASHSPKLTWKQFRLIAQASDQFEQYMMETHHGKSEDQLAHREHTRFTPRKAFKSRLDGLFSDEDSSESDVAVRAANAKASKKAKSRSKTKKKPSKPDSASSDSDGGNLSEEVVATSKKKQKKKKKGKSVAQQAESSGEEEEEEEEEEEKAGHKSKKKKKSKMVEPDSSDSDAES